MSRSVNEINALRSPALGPGTHRRSIAKCRSTEIPLYAERLRHVCSKLDWNGDAFRAYRGKIDYPIYRSQVARAFDPLAPP